MRKCAVALVALSFFSAAAEAADPPTIDPLLSVSQQQAAAQRFDLALQSLAEAAAMEPDNLEVKLQIARVHSWQGQYDRAEDELIDLAAADPDNADIRTALAYLDYYRGHNRQAAAEFSRILVTYPAYTDAVDGLKLAEEGQQVAAGFVWQFDAGFERSEFARQPTTPWNEEFAQITRFFDGGATALHARFDYYDEYKMANQYIEIGVDHRFAPWINAYLYGGYTIDATFRPRWRLEPGGNLRLVEEDTDTPAIWLTLDIKEDDYNPQVQIATIDPGLRLEYGDWAFSPNLVQVEQWGLTSIWGWNMRLDGPTGWEPLHFYVGYANAPETEDAITVYTASAYGGLVYNVDDAHALALAYTHDDRENSWIRHVVDLDFTDRF